MILNVIKQRRKVYIYRFSKVSRAIYILPIVSILLTITGCVNMPKQTDSPLPVVPYVDLNRYTGTWYEIARYPNSFQEGCVGSKATYTLRDDGKISVLNECYDKAFDGRIKSAKGKAWIVDKVTNARLRVSFFWPFSGDYWIVDLGKNYEYAVIGHPKRKYLWILSRTREMKEEVYEAILSGLRDQQYDTSRLLKTPQQ
jgi:apolipoprotein D and lipocalin family protein